MAHRIFLTIALNALVFIALCPSLQAQVPAASSARPLVVVELFQSQGCSSCPPAEANLNALADKPGILALSFGVTYWDNPGWKDTFAKDAYTQRQWSYAHFQARDTVWTPQIYINGHTDLVGTDLTQLEDAIAQAQSSGPSIEWSGNTLIVKAALHPPGARDVWLVRYDPRTLHVAIDGGENNGRTLPQRNVVRELIHLGTWDGSDETFALPAPSMGGLETAAIVQVRGGGDIQSASIQNAQHTQTASEQ